MIEVLSRNEIPEIQQRTIWMEPSATLTKICKIDFMLFTIKDSQNIFLNQSRRGKLLHFDVCEKNNFPGKYHHYNIKKIYFALPIYLKIFGVRKTVLLAGLQSAIRKAIWYWKDHFCVRKIYTMHRSKRRYLYVQFDHVGFIHYQRGQFDHVHLFMIPEIHFLN